WNDDDFDVLADGDVVGRIFKVHAAPVGTPWMWTLGFGHHEDRWPTHGYEASREAAMAAFAKSWRAPLRLAPGLGPRSTADSFTPETRFALPKLLAGGGPNVDSPDCRDFEFFPLRKGEAEISSQPISRKMLSSVFGLRNDVAGFVAR